LSALNVSAGSQLSVETPVAFLLLTLFKTGVEVRVEVRAKQENRTRSQDFDNP
jgi:hypothetical protein